MAPHLVGATPELGATNRPRSAVEGSETVAAGRVRLAALAVAASLALLPTWSAAQGVSTSAVRGLVTTTDGQPLSEVKVVVVHEPSGTRSTDVTDAEGRYYVPNLRPGGPYTVEATRLGFASSRRENVNLREPVESVHPDSGHSIGYGFGGRETYGIPTTKGFDPGRVSEEFGRVIRVTNDDRNFAWAASLELRKRFGDRFGLTAGYAHNRTGDTQSLLTSDVVANHGLNPVEGDPNRPRVRPALFDRPHKVVLSAWGRFFEEPGGTRVGLFYVGQSGRPYSYVYAGDVNGDGFPGAGRARERNNDLLYVPGDVVDSPSMTPGSLFAFHSLIGLDDCLTRARGSVLARNACRSPWSNLLDLRVTQELDLGGTGVEVNLDVLNLLNALDSEWGRVETTGRAVQLLALDGRRSPAGLEGGVADPLVSNYRGPIRTAEEDGIAAQLPHVPNVPESQWQAQLGVRVSW